MDSIAIAYMKGLVESKKTKLTKKDLEQVAKEVDKIASELEHEVKEDFVDVHSIYLKEGNKWKHHISDLSEEKIDAEAKKLKEEGKTCKKVRQVECKETWNHSTKTFLDEETIDAFTPYGDKVEIVDNSMGTPSTFTTGSRVFKTLAFPTVEGANKFMTSTTGSKYGYIGKCSSSLYHCAHLDDSGSAEEHETE